MDEFLDRLCAALGVDRGLLPLPAVLDLARDAAHSVERPAAPLTTFVAGLAAGLGGGSAADVERALRTAAELARAWGEPGAAPTPGAGA